VKKRVSFAVAGEADRSSGLKFSRVVQLVKSAYMVIGEQSWVEKYSGAEKRLLCLQLCRHRTKWMGLLNY